MEDENRRQVSTVKPLSQVLVSMLTKHVGVPSPTSVAAEDLISEYVNRFPDVRDLLVCAGRTSPVALVATIHRVSDCDSVVRDIVTCGHLGKILSRTSALTDPMNYKLLGLPHSVFDAISNRERIAFAESGATLHMFLNDDDARQAREFLRRENRTRHVEQKNEPKAPV